MYWGGKLKFSTLALPVFWVWFLILIPSISAQESVSAEILLTEETPAAGLRFAEAAPPESTPSGVNTWAIVRMILVLVLAAAAVYGVVFIFKRASKRAPESDPYLKILAASHLGSNRYAHIISVGSRAWLVGSGENGVSLISELDDKEIINSMLLDESQQSAVTRQGRFPDFIAFLRRAGVSANKRAPGADVIRKHRERLNGL